MTSHDKVSIFDRVHRPEAVGHRGSPSGSAHALESGAALLVAFVHNSHVDDSVNVSGEPLCTEDGENEGDGQIDDAQHQIARDHTGDVIKCEEDDAVEQETILEQL